MYKCDRCGAPTRPNVDGDIRYQPPAKPSAQPESHAPVLTTELTEEDVWKMYAEAATTKSFALAIIDRLTSKAAPPTKEPYEEDPLADAYDEGFK